MSENTLTPSENALASGSAVNNYQIRAFLGEDAFGISYSARHRKTNEKVVIYEYFPKELASRNEDGHLAPKDQENFAYGLQAFEAEIEKLKQLRHKNIAEIKGCFNDNGTAYRVTKFHKGQTLKQLLTLNRSLNKPKLSEKRLLNVVVPIVNALAYLDENDYFHQNLRPETIYLSSEDVPLLIGFGTFKQVLARKMGNVALSLKTGYAAHEQYAADRELRASTDIYALCASVYYAMTYEKPACALERVKARDSQMPDPLESATQLCKNDYRREFLQVIDQGLSLAPEQRPQTFAEFKTLLIEQQYKNRRHNRTPDTPPAEKRKKSSQVSELILLGLLLYILAQRTADKVETLDVPVPETETPIVVPVPEVSDVPEETVAEEVPEDTATENVPENTAVEKTPEND